MSTKISTSTPSVTELKGFLEPHEGDGGRILQVKAYFLGKQLINYINDNSLYSLIKNAFYKVGLNINNIDNVFESDKLDLARKYFLENYKYAIAI